VTQQNIPELWQLIQGRGPKDTSNPRRSGILMGSLERTRRLLRIGNHGPELENLKDLSVPPHTILAIEDGSTILKLDGKSNQPP
jgi:hypothetical protein